MQARFLLLLASAVIVAAVLAAPAAAAVSKGGGWRYVTKRFEVTAEENRTLKAPCPDGTHVYSGGYFNSKSYDHGFVLHSFPYDGGDRRRKPDDGWKARVLTRNPAVTWLVYAVCAKPMPKYPSREISISEGTGTTFASQNCGPGLNGFGGGTRGHDLEVETESGPILNPTSKGWTVRIESFTDVASELEIYAICADLPAAYPQAGTAVQPGTQLGHSVDCPPERKHVVAGGIFNDGQHGDVVIPASIPEGFPGPTTDSWRAYLDNYDGNNTDNAVNLTVRAVCSKSLN
jgi:hypothetical protein